MKRFKDIKTIKKLLDGKKLVNLYLTDYREDIFEDKEVDEEWIESMIKKYDLYYVEKLRDKDNKVYLVLKDKPKKGKAYMLINLSD